MTKEYIVKNSIKLIEMFAKELNLNVNNKGTGHAFDNSFWKDIFEDKSEIPEITANNEDGTFEIGLRSFWGNPEIDIHCKISKGSFKDLYVINFSDGKYDEGGNYIHTENFTLREIRIDADENHKKKLKNIHKVVKFIETSAGFGSKKVREIANTQ